jgi:hypothetical protein
MHLVAQEGFTDNDVNCGICQSSKNELCLNCSVVIDKKTCDCFIHVGRCGHEFHGHCVDNWLRIN